MGGYPQKKPTLAPEPAPPPSLQSPAPHPDAPAPAPFCSSPAVAPNRATAPPDHSGESPPSPNRCSALAILLPPPPQRLLRSSTGGYRQPSAEAPAPPASPRPPTRPPYSPRCGTESGPPPQIAAAYRRERAPLPNEWHPRRSLHTPPPP